MGNDSSDYLISVIIPVYNREESLAHCIDSLAKQTIAHDRMEAILVDDGSTDRSLDLCFKLKQQYSFLKIVHQENGGVSSARNMGIAHAKGKYIMFLDADDSISPPTMQSIVDCFDVVGNQVDLVTYPLRYMNRQTGSKRAHKREEWLKQEGVYALSDYPYIAQTTMNVCVKNRGENNILFDPKLKMGEDQLYILKNIAGKSAIGFTPKAEYEYIKNGSNSSRVGNNPLFAFDDMMTLYGEYLRIGENDSRLTEYARQTVLYNIDWRLRSNLLFPSYCEGEERKRQDSRLFEILRAIPSSSFFQSPYLSDYHKTYLLSLIGLIDKATRVSYGKQSVFMRLSDGATWETSLPRVLISNILEKDGGLVVSGRVMGPTLLLENKPTLKLISEGCEKELSLGRASYDYCDAKIRTAKGYSFSFCLPYVEMKRKEYRFELSIPGKQTIHAKVEFALLRHNAYVLNGGRQLFFRHSVAKLSDDYFLVSKRTLLDSIHAFADRMVNKRSSVAKRAAVKLFRLRERAEVWLYVDLPTSDDEGNALKQLLHDIAQEDGVNRYYVSNFGKMLTARYPQLKGCVIPCESGAHACYALTAKVILASYLESFAYRPVSQKTFDGIGDLVGDQLLVYLQHGVQHAHMPWRFSFDRLLFDKIVVSTYYEVGNLIRNYCFPEHSIIRSGMPRFDDLDSSPKRHLKKIAFIPSWRSYLLAGKASDRIELDDSFARSSFFTGIQRFFHLLRESQVLERHGYKMDVKLHPNFQCYAKMFDLNDGGSISFAPTHFDEGDYSIVITDFSSYLYDFVYIGCEVLFFVPDYLEFKAGLNHYSSLDLPLEENFGPLCLSAEKALSELEHILERDRASERKIVRPGRFFLGREGERRESLYMYCRTETSCQLNYCDMQIASR